MGSRGGTMDAEGRNEEDQVFWPGKTSSPPFSITGWLWGGESRVLGGADNLA